MDLEDIMVSDTSQSQKDKYCGIPLTQVPTEVRSIETERRWWCQGWEGMGMGSEYSMGTECQFWEDEKVLETDGGDGCTTV